MILSGAGRGGISMSATSREDEGADNDSRDRRAYRRRKCRYANWKDGAQRGGCIPRFLSTSGHKWTESSFPLTTSDIPLGRRLEGWHYVSCRRVGVEHRCGKSMEAHAGSVPLGGKSPGVCTLEQPKNAGPRYGHPRSSFVDAASSVPGLWLPLCAKLVRCAMLVGSCH